MSSLISFASAVAGSSVVDARRADGALCIRDHLKLLEPPPSLVVLFEVGLRQPGGHPHSGGERTHVVHELSAFGHEYSLTCAHGIVPGSNQQVGKAPRPQGEAFRCRGLLRRGEPGKMRR
jgi:hypothetical protein